MRPCKGSDAVARTGTCYSTGTSPVTTRDCMRRRQSIALIGSAAAWSMTARAQQTDRLRRVGMLMTLPAEDPEAQRRVTAFMQELQKLGWTEGRNIRLERRWDAGDPER